MQVTVGLVLALVVALLPVAAWAVPVATTTTLYATQGDVGGLGLQAIVSAPGGPPAGTVVFSEGGLELGRAVLTSGVALLSLDHVSVGAHTFTASYLGSADADPSTATATRTVVPATSVHPVGGTVSIGSRTFAVAPADTTSNTVYTVSAGRIALTYQATATSDITQDLPGFGPTTLAVSPEWTTFTADVGQDANVTVTSMSVRIRVSRITVGGTVWSASDCVKSTAISPATATLDAAGVAVSGSGAAPPALGSVSCAGRGALVDAMLGGPVTVAMHLDGPFPVPPPAVATSLTATVTGSGFEVGDRVPVRSILSASSCCPYAPLMVTYSENGVVLGTAYSSTNVIDGSLVFATPGTHTVTVSFAAQMSAQVTVFLGSSASVTVDVAGPPPGRPASGQIAIGTHQPAAWGPETRLSGAPFDPTTGAIGAGSFWFPAAILDVPAPLIGSAPVRYRMTQLAPMTGQVAADGHVTFTATTLSLEAREAQIFGSWSNLGDCTFSPIPMTLSGTADVTGLHLTASTGPIPPVPATGCGSYAPYVNPEMAAGATLTFDVAGDFRRSDATPVSVASWFPEVAQFNQTLVTASVAPGRAAGDPVPSGSMTFRDGAVVVGTVPVDAWGNASLPVNLSSPGTHTLAAVYSGDGSYAAGSETTTVVVTPAPTGYALGGSVTVGGASLPVGYGSQLVPASAPGPGVAAAGQVRDALASSNAALWFMPALVTVDAPGYGSVQAVVRLVQYGSMTSASIGAGGSIDGLAGMFVLQVQRVYTPSGVEVPLGCVNLVLLGFDGHLTFSDVSLTSAQAGVGRIPAGSCTGVGAAIITKLGSGPTAADLHATF